MKMKNGQIVMSLATQWVFTLFICVHPVHLWLAFSLLCKIPGELDPRNIGLCA